MGTDTPGITSPTLLCFAESRYRNGVSLAVYPKAATEAHTRKFLVFKEIEAVTLRAAVRAKELASEGVEVYGGLCIEYLQEFPDRRVLAPVAGYRLLDMEGMLEW